MKPSRFARQHRPRCLVFYSQALRSRNVFRPTSFAPLTSEVRHKALLRGTPNSKQATNSAAERRECFTSASTDETVGSDPSQRSSIKLFYGMSEIALDAICDASVRSKDEQFLSMLKNSAACFVL